VYFQSYSLCLSKGKRNILYNSKLQLKKLYIARKEIPAATNSTNSVAGTTATATITVNGELQP
jgi:hypothetical protein